MLFNIFQNQKKEMMEKEFILIRDEFIEKVKLAAEFSLQKRWEKTVLIIDENEEWANKLSVILNQHGYDTDILSDLPSTVSYIKSRNFRAIVTELSENIQSNYFVFIKKIKSIKPDTKIIIVSDRGNKDTIRNAFVELGVVDFFVKQESDGFNKSAFIERIEKIYRPENELYIVAKLEKKESNTYGMCHLKKHFMAL